jgi:membrane-associated phospholipid phosphatase
MNWKEYLRDKYFRNELIITLIVLAIVLSCFTLFLNYNENRDGIILADPILHFFKPIDLTWLTFTIIYLSIVLGLVYISQNPKTLIFTLQVYSLLLLIRMMMMFLLPLNPPLGMIPLNDPFVQNFGTGKILTKDLFFSGHTATIFMLYLVVDKKLYKRLFLVLTMVVGTSVLLQHVHYAVDVAAAPFFAYLSYRLVFLLQTKRLKKSLFKVRG